MSYQIMTLTLTRFSGDTVKRHLAVQIAQG